MNYHSRFLQTLDIARIVDSVRRRSDIKDHPLEFAPKAGLREEMGLIAGQQLWSLPLPAPTLTDCAVTTRADILMFRDMKDRDPLRSVRCDAAIRVGNGLIVLRDLIPHCGFATSPIFLTQEFYPAIALTPDGLTPVPPAAYATFRNQMEAVERAASLLTGIRTWESIA